MSRRPSSSLPRAAVSSPYPRRAPGQPKSSRQQFSACGACRMRRVRCDLKDFYTSPATNTLQLPSCSNCRERSIKCVDEFAEVKAVKLLRRGRRLQQVEAVYGKVADDVSTPSTVSQDSMPTMFSTAPAHNLIPQMQLPFLRSSFFRRFCIQRPVIEPGEFTSRYVAHVEGAAPLNIEGKILAMLLVTWAASFGVDEYGSEEDAEDATSENQSVIPFVTDDDDLSDSKEHTRMLRTQAMTKEILTLVDLHGLLRRPSWDGVRVLLLLLPLTYGVQSPLERLTTYEATLSHVHSLCNTDNSPSVNSGLGPYCDVLIRARVFWYAYVHEGITTGLKGGRLVLDDDDLTLFQDGLPPRYCSSAAHSIASSSHSARSSPVSSPTSPTFPFNSPLEASHPRAALAYLVATQYFSLAMTVSQACRAIHSTLTGPRARRQIAAGAGVSKVAVKEIWDTLESSWDNFEALRRNPSGVGAAGGDIIRGEDVERFVSGWQVFIFGCLNVIREALPKPTESGHAAPVDQVTMTSLHLSAIRQCQKFLPRVIEMLQRHLKVPSNFFAYDAGLICDGCFFAGLLLAQSDKLSAERDVQGWDADWEEGVMACLQALSEVRWVYSHSHELEKTVKAEWGARIERDTSRRQVQESPMSFPFKQSPGHSPSLNDIAPLPCPADSNFKPRTLSLVSAGGRPHLPPLSISLPSDDSGPDTVLTDDGSGSWEPYTPPPTSGSITGTVMTHRSLSPTTPPRHLPTGPIHGATKKGSLFVGGDDVDQFSFTTDRTPDSRGSGVGARWTPYSYLDPHVALTTSDVLGCDDGFFPLASNRPPYIA